MARCKDCGVPLEYDEDADRWFTPTDPTTTTHRVETWNDIREMDK